MKATFSDFDFMYIENGSCWNCSAKNNCYNDNQVYNEQKPNIYWDLF